MYLCPDRDVFVLVQRNGGKWRSISQEGIDELWKELWDIVEEQILDKYKNVEPKQGTDQGRRESSDWRNVKKQKRY